VANKTNKQLNVRWMGAKRLQIIKGKKLVVHFGGVWQKEGYPEGAELEDAIRERRKKIIEGLNNSKELKAVSDLMPQGSSDSYFDPIIFSMHIPLSLQAIDDDVGFADNDNSEDFRCVYDGCCLFIASLCDIDTDSPSPLFVRDRFFNILNGIIDSEKVPPCLFPGKITFVCRNEPILTQKKIDYFAACKENTNSKEIFSYLIQEVGYQIGDFYELASLAAEVSTDVGEIENKINDLLKEMTGISKESWRGRFFTNTSKQRKKLIGILAAISDCQSTFGLLERKTRDYKMVYADDPISKVIENKSVEFYGTPYLGLDTNSFLKTVELIRNELDSYSRNRLTILTALTGGAAGAVITLIATHLL
jgi:hypothetical protein